MTAFSQLETLTASIERRRIEEDALRAGFAGALAIANDITAVNTIVSATRPELVMTEPVPQRQIETYPFDHRRAGNFIPRLKGFGDPLYVNRPAWPGGPVKRTLVRCPVTNLGFETYVHLAARGSRDDYPAFAEQQGIDPEMALDAFDYSLTRYGAFARMVLIAPELTRNIIQSCVRRPEQPRDPEIYIAYNLAALLVDRNDREVKGAGDNQVLSR